MMLVELTSPPVAALPIEAFRAHLRLGSGFSGGDLQDPLLEACLRAALAAIEARTGKVLLEREFRWTVTAWRNTARQPLPLAPVSAVVSLVRYTGDDAQTPPQTAYRLEADMQRPLLVSTGATLPAVPRGGRIEVVLLAGFGPEWSDLPADLAQAVLLLAAHYYEYRVETEGRSLLPPSVAALIERYRTVRLFMGGK
ncbi:head-tail connector protein [Loktanella sp. SALINAS62]|uniref:head-tail connector protein n=1 Tax=Loktanella sp. SALINAS62 TaxID=2706124 RepID=UPI001B8B9051|nr:head-tail connector protein [Loktanella sp. SALINAS62]MBS1303593.1 hypothetical protein [Loktanella sp. SALINAS62]